MKRAMAVTAALMVAGAGLVAVVYAFDHNLVSPKH
jgi:hypothetical protein